MKLILGNEGDQARRSQDGALIKAVARGHDCLMTGKAGSEREIAWNEKLSNSYVSCVL